MEDFKEQLEALLLSGIEENITLACLMLEQHPQWERPALLEQLEELRARFFTSERVAHPQEHPPIFPSKLEEEKDWIKALLALKQLTFAHPSIEDLVYLKRLPHLDTLIIKGQSIQYLPTYIKEFRALQELRLQNTGIHHLPAVLSQLPHLDSLHLAGSPVQNLPTLPHLYTLSLGHSDCPLLPKGLEQLTALTQLSVEEGIQEQEDWTALSRLAALREFSVYNSLVVNLPSSLSACSSLHLLCLRYVDLQNFSIPKDAWPLLEQLDLSGNVLEKLEGDWEQWPLLKIVDLSDNQLQVLPKGMGGLSQLAQLNLSNNQLIAFPEGANQLPQLINLQLSNNALQTLPEDWQACQRLRRLALDNNQLQYLPKGLFSLPALFILSLANNQLTSLPEGWEQWTHLRELNLMNNQLTALPTSLGALPVLEQLHLNNNQLSHLPNCLAELPNLRLLSLRDNPIQTLPAWLLEHPNLPTIYLDKRLKNDPIAQQLPSKKIYFH